MSNSRKRQRLVTVGDFEFADDDGITTTSATALPINASLAGHSIFLTQNSDSSNNNNAILPANVFLTICDDISDDEANSPEYLFDSSALATHIKQEQDASTQTQTTLPRQYRIVNRLQHEQLQLEADNTNVPIEEISAQSPTHLPAAMQLPSGCEIYLVKEYVGARTGNSDLLAAAAAAPSNNNSSSGNNSNRSAAIVKLEADTQTAAARTSSSGSNAALRFRGNATASLTSAKAAAPAAPLATTAGTAVAQRNKRSFILETYKKRDDKRRATHNEVERRRRDKINSWIFKLKEMLPAEATQCNNNNNSTATSVAASSSSDCVTTSEQQRHGSNSQNSANSRTPPNDSKSQILIKACEYIKAMQDEIKSLRECLTENENLRSCNQRLQSELNKLKRKSDECAYSNSNMLNNSSSNHNNSSNSNSSGMIRNNNNPNSTLNLTLNTLNRNGLFGSNALQMTTSTAANALGRLGSDTGAVHNLSPTTYAKRELIIRDYVD